MFSSEEERWGKAREIATTVERVHSHLIANLTEGFEVPDVTPRQVVLLFLVRDRSGASIKELAGLLRVTPSSVSTMVDRLVEGGMLTREPNPGDRREVMVRISPEFEKTLEPLERRALHAIMTIIERLGPEIAETWYSISTRVGQVIDEEEGKILRVESRPAGATAS